MALTAGQLYRRALVAYWPAYTLGFVTMLLTSLSEVLTPKFIQWGLDVISSDKTARWTAPAALLGNTRRETLETLIFWMLVTIFLGWIGRCGWRLTLARRTHVAGRDLKLGLWNVLRQQPLDVFQRYPLGDLMNRATGDWNASRFIHGFTIVMTFDLVFFAGLALVAMFMIDIELTLYSLVVFLFLPPIIVRLARKEHDLHVHAQEKLGHLSDSISQALSTVRLSRATASDAIWQKVLSEDADEYAKRRFEVIKTAWKIFPLGALPTLIAYAVLLVIGVDKIRAGETTIGEFVALLSYVLMLQAPLFELGDCIAEWQKGFASLGRIVEIFNLSSKADALFARKMRPPPPQQGLPAIHVRALGFAYEGIQRRVLVDINLEIRAGERIGILGPVGAGKSTLLKLMGGLEDPPPGHLMLFDRDVVTLDRQWLADKVTMVPQRAFLFAGTIRMNLLLDAAYDDDELWRVLELTRLARDVRALADGLDTWIGEWGTTLSGGQKQRLALARALLRPRQIFLLDDCLSAVDAITEEEILSGMVQRLGGVTVVWVAHRLSTLKACERIFVLKAGRLLTLAQSKGQDGGLA